MYTTPLTIVGGSFSKLCMCFCHGLNICVCSSYTLQHCYNTVVQNFAGVFVMVWTYACALVIHCSTVITRSSGAMNTDRVILGPRYTEHDNHTHLHHCSFLQLLWDITHCMYVILYVPFFIYLFFIFFYCRNFVHYFAWFLFYSFNPVNNKFLSLNCFVFFYDHSRELTATVLHYG